MYYTGKQALFEDRYDAGKQLAEQLGEYEGESTVVLAIPNGGVPVGLEVSLALQVVLDLVISRKLPLPLAPEAGFGAVADDGTVILNEDMVNRYALTRQQIDYQVIQVREEIRQRKQLYRKDKPPTVVSGKTVIITDDGLATGFTMLATVASVRRRQPREIIVAVPVSSAKALEQVEKVSDKVVTIATGSPGKFAVADYYRRWYDLNDDEVIQCLREWRMRRLKLNIELPPENNSV
ncbi:MAG: phosphoribosyltransferase family protein [Dehalococcoidales bacterium]